MTVPICMVWPIFFLTCVTLLMISFAFMVSISATLGDFRLAASDHSTLGTWLAVTINLGCDAFLLVSYFWGGWNILWSLLIASLVLYPWSMNGVLGCGFCRTVRRSWVICVSLYYDYVCGMFTCAGNNSTVLITLSPLVFGMYQYYFLKWWISGPIKNPIMPWSSQVPLYCGNSCTMTLHPGGESGVFKF